VRDETRISHIKLGWWGCEAGGKNFNDKLSCFDAVSYYDSWMDRHYASNYSGLTMRKL